MPSRKTVVPSIQIAIETGIRFGVIGFFARGSLEILMETIPVNIYLRPIGAGGYCHPLRWLSIHQSGPHYHCTAHNILWSLHVHIWGCIFGTASDLRWIINPIDYGVSMFIFHDPVALLKVYEYTDWLASWLGQPRVPILWTVHYTCISFFNKVPITFKGNMNQVWVGDWPFCPSVSWNTHGDH